ncbi:autotransporter outer membrane beta-barrel domain-containing protein [Campylobacter vulpis]|uniref:autotransporter outer membrane beta-barrel domain-containing protein n=2 Tax=Campylobacter vulpis TaxID=1655500 RepID=UPI00223E8F71|nr:autotransporter outer membrane beta-barrel domain-containing protein [Campylobacter vulpis]
MLSCNQQGIHNLPSYLNSHSFKSRLIPSFLALSVITALYSPLQANWVYNKPGSSPENSQNITTSSNATVQNKNWIFYTSNSGTNGNLTINHNLSASGTGTGGGVNVSNGHTVGTITIDSDGSLSTQHHGININSNANVSEISINGNLSASGNNGQGININNNANVGTITLGSNGSISSQHRRAILVNKNATINHIDIQGTITNGRGVWNDGIIGSNGSGGSSGSSGTTTPGIKVTGNITSTSESAAALGNGGTINGSIVVESGTLSGGMKYENNPLHAALANEGVINGDIEIKQGATLKGGVINWDSFGTTNAGKVANIKVHGTVNGMVANFGGVISGSIEIENGANVTESIFNSFTSRLAGTIQGGITIKGTVGGGVDNRGKLQGDIKVENTGTLNGGIHNSGTIGGKIQNEAKNAITIYNRPGASIANGIENKGTATIRNQGKIQSGIINDGGTLTVINDFRRDENAADGYHTIGEIGKTASGVHIENKGGGKLHINAWYFNKEDYATAEERKANALLVDGDFANISIGDSFINTKGLDVDKTYNSYSLIADKDGNAVGDKVNNGQGIDVNKLHSVSGIYSFENFGGAGQYRANINRDELSGRTLAQSIIYSQRVRNVNLSRILREATTQVFVSGKESEVNANGKSLSQLEQLHTNHRDENTKNHTFVIPYYQNFSADLGSHTGKLKSNSSGMLIATQRELPNDYGVFGVYAGFENADQKVAGQRIEMDGNSYYAGLTYNHSFYEDDLTTYFMNLTTKLDYIERDVEKTYRGYIGSASSTAKVFGYGANARVGLSHYLHNDAKITPQIGFNYLGMHNKPFTLNHLGGTREHYLAQSFNFIDAVATIKYETPWINRFKTAVALGTIFNVYKDAKGTLHLDSNVLNAELDIARLYGVVQGGVSYDLTKDSDISLGYSGIFSSANTIRSHALMFRYAWWW